MKKRYLSAATAIVLACSLVCTSCIGSFTLTNKLLAWNKTVGNKFVNELVFFAFWILPVYEVSSLADALVLNSIEFWSGTNPVAHKGTKEVKGTDGERYLVDCDADGYTITKADGTVTRLDFDAENRAWSVTAGGETYQLLAFTDDNHVALPAADGTYVEVELSDAGLMAYEGIARSVAPMAAK